MHGARPRFLSSALLIGVVWHSMEATELVSILGFRCVLGLISSGMLAWVTLGPISHPEARLCGLVLKVVKEEGILLV